MSGVAWDPWREDPLTVRGTFLFGNRCGATRGFSRSNAHHIFRLVPLLPVYGHVALRERLREAVERDGLPASLLLHGPRGIGKQQLALWLARALLCDRSDAMPRPCGACKACRMAAALHHPDLHWFFPRPRLKGGEPEPEDIREDIAEAIAARMETSGVYEAPGGDEGIFVATVRAVVQTAALSPAMSRRKVFVIGDADRMIAQEGLEYAANAFLKVLEEPPANTSLILTSSEPGALLPTIRSRVVMLRVPPLGDADVRAFLADPTVSSQLDLGSQSIDDAVRVAAGAPGRIIDAGVWRAALADAKKLLAAAEARDRGPAMRLAFAQSTAGARGKFSDTLDALTTLLHERARNAAERGESRTAAGAARAVDAVEQIKELAGGNVNPQLLTSSLLRRLAPLVQ